jgi:membrane protease YdiL (CAAX protease family)
LPPAQGRAAWGCALIFTLGHGMTAWPAAFAYFTLTTVFYRRTRSFRACVMVHGLVNLGIAILVRTVPGMRFLWY